MRSVLPWYCCIKIAPHSVCAAVLREPCTHATARTSLQQQRVCSRHVWRVKHDLCHVEPVPGHLAAMSPLIAPELVGCCKNPVITLQPDQARSKQEPSAIAAAMCEIYIEGRAQHNADTTDRGCCRHVREIYIEGRAHGVTLTHLGLLGIGNSSTLSTCMVCRCVSVCSMACCSYNVQHGQVGSVAWEPSGFMCAARENCNHIGRDAKTIKQQATVCKCAAF
jgi:hypothetical protein